MFAYIIVSISGLVPLSVTIWSMLSCGKKKNKKGEIMTASMMQAPTKSEPVTGSQAVLSAQKSEKKKENEPPAAGVIPENPSKEVPGGGAIKDDKKPEESRKLQPYPSIKEPTPSQKKKREDDLEKEKKDKIAKGFYQSKSDEDDTLEKINSLKEEESERSKKNKSIKNKSVKK